MVASISARPQLPAPTLSSGLAMVKGLQSTTEFLQSTINYKT